MYRSIRTSLFFFSILLAACADQQQELLTEIQTLEAEVSQSPSDDKISQLLTLYQKAGETMNDESLRLDYLWKAGESARTLQDYQLAEQIYQDIYNHHQESEYAAKALFLHAFMSDEDLNNFSKAEALYKVFLQKYPDSEFADDAEFLLNHLGKSDEEILKILTEKNEVQEQ